VYVDVCVCVCVCVCEMVFESSGYVAKLARLRIKQWASYGAKRGCRGRRVESVRTNLRDKTLDEWDALLVLLLPTR
jgi:hypothetical protein